MTNERSVSKILRSIGSAILALLLICSMLSVGPRSAFASDEAVTPLQTQQPEPEPQPSNIPEAQAPQVSEAADGQTPITQVDGKDCAEGEIIVKFKDNVSDAGVMNSLESVESGAVQQLPPDNLVVTEVPEGETVESFIDTMEAMPGVEYAQPNYLYTLVDPVSVSDEASYTPEAAATDPYAYKQWYLDTIRLSDAWDITMGSSDVLVAVIDTGVDLDHPDLIGQIVAQTDVVDYDGSADDDNGHGTHVAGIVAASANNGIGGTGVAPGVKLIAVDVFTTYIDEYGELKWGAYTSDIIEGVKYAISNGADVINLSLGSYDDDIAFEKEISDIAASGVPVVCAAGNENTSDPHYPSDYEAAISVIATGWGDTRASYSNYGAAKDISAPGGDNESSPYSYIFSTYPGTPTNPDRYAWMDGTSMAAPVVSGVVALMLSAHPGLSIAEIKSLLYSTADELGVPGRDVEYGDGRVNAYYAVAAAYDPVHVSSVTLSGESAAMAIGDTLTLGTAVLPANTTFPKVIWSTSNAAVATVDRTGRVTAIDGGTAVITATADGVSDTCSITVPFVTVAFDSRGGSPVSPMVKALGSTISASPSTSQAGYAFAGWYPTPEYNTAPIAFPYRVTGGGTLYAKWAVNSYTVSFDSKGGSAVPAQTVAYNSGIYQPPAPVKAGYTFAGWYREPYCSTPWTFGYDMVQSDITLYANWQAMGPYLANTYVSAGSMAPAFSRAIYSYKIYLGENEPGVTITPEREYTGASMTINGRAVTSLYVPLANGKTATVTVKTRYGTQAKTYKFTVSRAKSMNNYLASLTAAGTMDKPFDPNVADYTLYLDEGTKSTTLKASAANASARVSPASSKVTLNNGQSKTVRIQLRAQSGAVRYYTVTVVRAASTDANAKSLKASYLSPGFNANITNYSITMPANKSSASISVKPSGYKAAVYIDGVKKSSAKIALANGQSIVVRITVAAQAGNTKDYYITVSRL